jgi:undecaprenyl-diphosphatase
MRDLDLPASARMTPRAVPPGLRRFLDAAHVVDVRVYQAVAGTSTPQLDEPLRVLSGAANYSRLSMAAAALLALTGPRGRRAAVAGLASVAVTSATVNIVAKLATRRRRPARADLGVLEARHVPMPQSTSFPSGHSASAFAFSAGVGHVWPVAAVPLHALAATVAYSRVHTGVHYPGDVLAGSLIGVGAAALTTRLLDRRFG